MRGYNYVRSFWACGDPEPESWHVRSVWVYRNDLNWVEMGWCKGYECGPHESEWVHPYAFKAWKINGVYGEEEFKMLPPPSRHYFNVNNPYYNYRWKFWLDGTYYGPDLVHWYMNEGEVGGQSEVHEIREGAYTRWWGLQLRTSLGWADWYRLECMLPDSNPDWKCQKISNTEFKVVRE